MDNASLGNAVSVSAANILVARVGSMPGRSFNYELSKKRWDGNVCIGSDYDFPCLDISRLLLGHQQIGFVHYPFMSP